MPAVCCVCENCGNIFYAKDEMYIPAHAKTRMRFANSSKEFRTWEDWLLHISSNCPDCRIKEVPVKCMDDYNKLKGV